MGQELARLQEFTARLAQSGSRPSPGANLLPDDVACPKTGAGRNPVKGIADQARPVQRGAGASGSPRVDTGRRSRLRRAERPTDLPPAQRHRYTTTSPSDPWRNAWSRRLSNRRAPIEPE